MAAVVADHGLGLFVGPVEAEEGHAAAVQEHFLLPKLVVIAERTADGAPFTINCVATRFFFLAVSGMLSKT